MRDPANEPDDRDVQLFMELYPTLVSFVSRKFGFSQDQARDVVSLVWIFFNRPRVIPIRNKTKWFFWKAINFGRDHIRKEGRLKFVEIENFEANVNDHQQIPTDLRVQNEDLREKLIEVILDLPRNQMEFMTQYFLRGKDLQEIQKDLNLPTTNAVHQLKNRSIKSTKALFAKRYGLTS